MVARWRGASLRFHLLVEFAVAFGIILLAFLYEGVQALNSSTTQALEEREVVAQLMAERIDGHLGRAREAIQGALVDPALDLEDGNLSPERVWVQTLYDRSMLFKRIVLMDVGGIVLWTAPYTETMIGVTMVDPPYNVRLPLTTQATFAVNIGPSTGKPGVAVIQPIVSPRGGLVGYLSGWINLSDSRAIPLLFPYEPRGEGYSDLVDEKGWVLMSSRPERVGITSDHAGHFTSLVQVRQSTVGTCHSCHDPEGAGRQNDMLAFAPLSLVSWGVALRQPETEVFATSTALAVRLWLVGLAVLVVFLSLIVVTTRQILRPMQGLAEASRRIAAGDLSHPVPLGGPSEAAGLARSFEAMRKDLLGYRKSMETVQSALERSVEERTAELTLARDYLLKTNRNLSSLNVIAATLSQSLDLTQTLSAALGRTLEAIATPAGGIYVRERGQAFKLAAHQGLPPGALAILDRLPGPALMARPGVAEETAWLEESHSLLTKGLGDHSVLCVPLEAKGSVLGLLFAADRSQRCFVPEDRTLLSSIAWQIAMAVRNARLFDALQQEERTRGRLLHKVIAAQEDERKRIARELHDETSQAITALMLGLDTTGLALANSPQEAVSRLGAAKGIAQAMLENIHRLTSDLRPPQLDDLGLIPAITWYGEQRLQPAGVALRLENDGLDQRLPPAMETALFRIVQEAMTNVIRHAGAKTVTVSLSLRHGQMTLRVADDGRGGDPRVLRADNSKSIGLGLRGMQERVSILGGEFEITTALGQGTVIIVTVPVQAREAIRD